MPSALCGPGSPARGRAFVCPPTPVQAWGRCSWTPPVPDAKRRRRKRKRKKPERIVSAAPGLLPALLPPVPPLLPTAPTAAPPPAVYTMPRVFGPFPPLPSTLVSGPWRAASAPCSEALQRFPGPTVEAPRMFSAETPILWLVKDRVSWHVASHGLAKTQA